MMAKDLFSSQTPCQLNILRQSSSIYFDSIFKPVPEIFYQLFVIHGEYNNILIPCVFALMERKTEIMYKRVWEKVRENVEITCQTAFVRSIRRTYMPQWF
ncbi:hypothetical protein HZS_2894 [Henneguya salminicola]|nr:hypothetical protein HZS_2894 [Henneguya salminicola]